MKAQKLFNLGYSQGGQTTMGVLRLVAERYPDIEDIGPSGDTPAHKNAASTFGFKALATMIALMSGDK